MNFSSDNTAPVAPEILEAIVRANEGFAPGYGADAWTNAVERRFSEIFERDVAVFLVPTGTASNALALAHVAPPWGVVLCHAESHIATDECGAPEFFGAGLKLVGLPGTGAKIAPDEAAALSDADIALKVQRPLTAAEGGPDEVALLKRGAMLVGILSPYGAKEQLALYAGRGINAFAMEFMPESPGPRPWTCCPRRPIWRAIAP